MKIPFGIKYRPQIESGEYKVQNRDGDIATILEWDIFIHGMAHMILIRYNDKYEFVNYNGRVNRTGQDCSLDLFIVTPEPELTEDEMVTAEIVDFIQRNADRGDDIMKSAGWIAYLERQKEYIEDIRQYAYNKGLVDAEEKQKPVKFDAYTKVDLDRALQIVKDAKENLSAYQTDDGIYECDHAIQTLERILNNGIDQKPAEWSDKDESYLQTVINEIEANKKEAREYEHKKYDSIILWLKSRRPQPKQEWSKEDKEMLGKVLECIRFAEDRYQLEEEQMNGVSVKLWLLEHINPQPHWKPSDEQMKALNEVANNGVLLDLFNDLLKLL